MSLPFACALAALLAAAAWSDLCRRRIPNALPAAIVGLWLLAAAQGVAPAAIAAAATALALLAAGMMVWRCGWLGGGDVKLVAALGLWAGPRELDALLLGTTFAGGVMALAGCLAARLDSSPALLLARLAAARFAPWPLPGGPLTGWRERGLPYGVAVAAGGGWLVHRLLAV